MNDLAAVKGKVNATKRRPDHERRGRLKVMVSNGKTTFVLTKMRWFGCFLAAKKNKE
jgi:hypothetical protein